ncbi:hypothetical protein ACTXGU_05155 [Niallia sp. 01092]
MYKSSNGLNGLGTLAQDFLDIFEEITCRKDLKATHKASTSRIK